MVRTEIEFDGVWYLLIVLMQFPENTVICLITLLITTATIWIQSL